MKNEKLGKGISIFDVENDGDERGSSYNVPKSAFDFVTEINDAHVATIVPGAIRGNHFHVGRKEFILVWFSDSWILAWDQGSETNAAMRTFSGAGLKLIEIDMDISHAIKNIGSEDILIMAFSNRKYNVEKPDTYRRIVI